MDSIYYCTLCIYFVLYDAWSHIIHKYFLFGLVPYFTSVSPPVAFLPVVTRGSLPILLTSLPICSAAVKGVRGHRHTLAHTLTHAQTQTRHVSSVLPLRLAATDRNSSLYVKAGQLQHAHTCTHSQQYDHVRLSLLLSVVFSHAYAHRSTCIMNIWRGTYNNTV